MIDELRNQLTRYVLNATDRRALEDWLVSHLQAILDSDDNEAIELANALDVLFLKLGDEFVTEEEFLEQVAALSFKPRTVVVMEPTVIIVEHPAGSATLQSDSLTPDARPVWVPS